MGSGRTATIIARMPGDDRGIDRRRRVGRPATEAAALSDGAKRSKICLLEAAVNTLTFPEFEARARAQGFDEVVERNWAPGTLLDDHRHPFGVQALVVRGEMWLQIDGGDDRHLLPGDSFALDADVPHRERYGAEGATYWVARRNRAAG